MFHLNPKLKITRKSSCVNQTAYHVASTHFAALSPGGGEGGGATLAGIGTPS